MWILYVNPGRKNRTLDVRKCNIRLVVTDIRLCYKNITG